jgi:hypothetical protein
MNFNLNRRSCFSLFFFFLFLLVRGCPLLYSPVLFKYEIGLPTFFYFFKLPSLLETFLLLKTHKKKNLNMVTFICNIYI